MPKNPEFMGKMVEVDIYESGKHFLKGQPVSNTKIYTPSISKPLAKGEVSGLTKVSSRFLSPTLLTIWQLRKHRDLRLESVITCRPHLRMRRFCSFLADGDLEVQLRGC